MTTAKYITTETLADVLDLPEDASDTDILDRIHALREAADEEPADDSGEATLIRRGEHERVKLNDDGTATVTMLKPFKFATETIAELTLREPTVGDFQAPGIGDQMGSKKGGLKGSIELMARLAGRTSKELAGMKAVDMRTVSTVIAFLSGDGR